jgi:hypothetical protein
MTSAEANAIDQYETGGKGIAKILGSLCGHAAVRLAAGHINLSIVSEVCLLSACDDQGLNHQRGVDKVMYREKHGLLQ